MTHKVCVGHTRPLKDEEIVLQLGQMNGLSLIVQQPKPNAELLLMEVHLGSHVCEFAVEPLDSGGFTIVCLNHPVELTLAQPSN